MSRLVFRTTFLDSVPSTNNVIKQAIEQGEPEGLVACACEQTGGYGRQGRTWASPRGGLYCSWLLRPQVPVEQLSTFSLVVGIAIQRTFASFAPEHAEAIRIKWPNDVVFLSHGGKTDRVQKLCGISLESYRGALCAGTGLNIFPPPERVTIEGKNTPCFLSELADFDYGNAESVISIVFDKLKDEFQNAYELWVKEGFQAFVQDYSQHASLTGRFVSMIDQSEHQLASGMVVGVDLNGRLLLRDTEGRIQSVSSGEAHIV